MWTGEYARCMQEVISTVLHVQELQALSYMDDVLVFSDSVAHHLEQIQMVFNCLRKNYMKLKPSKCNFFKLEALYLGF